jgi:hypothetical protein
MKKTLFSAMALGALAMSNLKAQTSWTQGTGTLYANPTTTKIGIGTNNPTEALTVNGGGFALKTGTNIFNIGTSGILAGTPSFDNSPVIMEIGHENSMGGRTKFTGLGIEISGYGYGILTTGKYRTPSNITNGTSSTGLYCHQADLSVFTKSTRPIIFGTKDLERMRITGDGKVVIGDAAALSVVTASPANPLTDPRLFVQGGILTEKLKVAPKNTADWSWPDYVFSKSYKLNSLDSVETFINKNSHLPDVPSAKEIGTNGFDVAEMDAKLLRKVEELTLYVIEISKKEKENKEEVAVLKKKIEALETENNELKK